LANLQQPTTTTAPPTGIGQAVQPGVDPTQLYSNQALTQQQLDALAEAYRAQLEGQLAGVGIEGQKLEYQKLRGQEAIARQEAEGRRAAINNALQRGIYRSGIRVGNEQEVSELAGIARMDLEHGITMGLMELQNRVAQLNNDFSLNLANASSQFTQEDLQFYGNAITQGGGVIGSNASGSNTNPYNVSAARSGQGAYGARAQTAASMVPQLQAMFPALRWNGSHYFRPLSQIPEGGSTNSDHYTGGALDIGVNPNNPDEYAQAVQLVTTELPKLKAAGIVSGWIWHPDKPNDAHYGHVHVSFALAGGSANVNTANVTGITSTVAPQPTPSPVSTSTNINSSIVQY